MSSLNISNVIQVSVATPPSGLADFQVNNLAIFTKEIPANLAITTANPGIYKSPSDVADDWGIGSEVYGQAVAIFSQSPNILDGDGQLVIYPMGGGDTLAISIPALQKIVYFGGALYAGYSPNDAELLAAAPICEPLRVKLFASQYLTAALTVSTGVFANLSALDATHTRMLLYSKAGTAFGARAMAAATAGRAMSVDFHGSATTNTMHLKQLVTIAGDDTITQTILDRCIVLGVDAYPLIAGRASYFSTGNNGFFDDVYNLDWFVLALQVAGFNVLATTGTKVPQTEPGIAVLRGGYLAVLREAVINGYIAPGAWNSPELFGSPVDLIRNVLELGYYIYSQPVNQQQQAARAARQAPLIQIAIKLAGAVHSSSVVVNVNA